MRKKILLRNLFFLLGSWISAGTQNVVTQLYFASYSELERGKLVAITLLVGSLMSMLGIYLSKWYLNHQKTFIVWWLILFNVSFTFQYFIKCWWLYIIAHGVTLGLYHGLFNYVDYSFISCTPKEAIKLHTGSLLFYQMLGYTVAPIFFTSFEKSKIIAIGILWVIMSLVASVDIPILLKNSKQLPQLKPAVHQHKKLQRNQYLFLFYCLTMQTAIAMLLAEVVYIMSDYYGFENYGFVSSCYLGALVMIASCTVISSSLHKDKDTVCLKSKMQILGSGCLLGSVFLIFMRLEYHLSYIVVCGIIGGIGYGLYMGLSREYVVKSSHATGNSTFLTYYNSEQILSSISAYSLSLFLSLLSQQLGINHILWGLIVGMSLMGVGIVVLVILAKMQREEKQFEVCNEVI